MEVLEQRDAEEARERVADDRDPPHAEREQSIAVARRRAGAPEVRERRRRGRGRAERRRAIVIAPVVVVREPPRQQRGVKEPSRVALAARARQQGGRAARQGQQPSERVASPAYGC